MVNYTLNYTLLIVNQRKAQDVYGAEHLPRVGEDIVLDGRNYKVIEVCHPLVPRESKGLEAHFPRVRVLELDSS
jgi:hypothetical protein